MNVDNGTAHINTINSTIYSTAEPIEEDLEGNLQIIEEPQKKPKAKPKQAKKPVKPVAKKKKKVNTETVHNDPTKLEENASQVKERFRRGCECQDESCFRGLNPETVYKHRLNIAELTKGEHDMYLMGVTMACLANPDTTVRLKERRRLRAQYVYQGRRVCLDAFLYLENCTHYQLKRIRKHVMTHGVAPRVHGNHGKKPHNTFSLNIYRHATEFLKQYLEQYTVDCNISNPKQIVQLPWDITRKNLHDAYKGNGQLLEPGLKLMGYSTFRHFMKEQFPQVRFCKAAEPKGTSTVQQQPQPAQQLVQQQVVQAQPQQPEIQQQLHTQHIIQKHDQIQTQIIDQRPREQQQITTAKCLVNSEVIPLVVAQNEMNGAQHQQAFLVTPVPQLLPNGNIVTVQNPNNHPSNAFSYQLTNTGYVINEQGNILTTMSSAVQHHTPYTINRM